MKYCIQFYQNCRYINEVDEITIKYQKQILKYLETAPKEQRIIIDISKVEDENIIDNNLEIFSIAKLKHENLTIKMSKFLSNKCEILKEKNISYFFAEFVDKWDVLMSFIKMGVSDVYIVNELGFELQNVSKVCKKNNVNIRVFPNVAQNSYGSNDKKDNLDRIKSFFIRPEDIWVYEPYVDVCEFFGPLDRQSVLYKIYSSGRWLGSLEELIIGLQLPILNKTILLPFGEERLNCRKKCYYGQCLLCEKILSIAKYLEEAGMELVMEKGKVENDENKHEFNEKSDENVPRTIT